MLPSLMTPTQKASARGVQEIIISRGEGGRQCALLGELIKWIRAGMHKSRAPDCPSDYILYSGASCSWVHSVDLSPF
jgi:hypothetical protein